MAKVTMAGPLAGVDVEQLIASVRRCAPDAIIRLWDGDERETGMIRIESGRLLDAHCLGERGQNGLRCILRQPELHTKFRVEEPDSKPSQRKRGQPDTPRPGRARSPSTQAATSAPVRTPTPPESRRTPPTPPQARSNTGSHPSLSPSTAPPSPPRHGHAADALQARSTAGPNMPTVPTASAQRRPTSARDASPGHRPSHGHASQSMAEGLGGPVRNHAQQTTATGSESSASSRKQATATAREQERAGEDIVMARPRTGPNRAISHRPPSHPRAAARAGGGPQTGSTRHTSRPEAQAGPPRPPVHPHTAASGSGPHPSASTVRSSDEKSATIRARPPQLRSGPIPPPPEPPKALASHASAELRSRSGRAFADSDAPLTRMQGMDSSSEHALDSDGFKSLSARELNEFSPKITALAHQVEPLAGLIVVRSSDARVAHSWYRNQPIVSHTSVATYLAKVSKAHRECFLGQGTARASHSTTIGLTVELPSATVLIHGLRADAIVGFVFEDETPLGLMRLVVDRVSASLTRLIAEEMDDADHNPASVMH